MIEGEAASSESPSRHPDTSIPGELCPHHIVFGRDPLGRRLPLSGGGMAIHAKDFLARQETTAQKISQWLDNEYAVRAKAVLKLTSQKLRIHDPVWGIRLPPMGEHRTKSRFTPAKVLWRIGEDTYRVEAGPKQFRKQLETLLRDGEPNIRWKHVSLDYTPHEPN